MSVRIKFGKGRLGCPAGFWEIMRLAAPEMALLATMPISA